MYYSTNTTHPVTSEVKPRIDVYYGKRQDDAAEDVMTLVHQSMPMLRPNQGILIINALCVHDDLIAAIDRIAKPGNAAAYIYSACGSKLREKFAFLSNLIAAKNVRLLVLNSFEFAAYGSRQKHALCNWLREMRDAHKLRVVIYSLERAVPKFGALANIEYASSSTAEVGKWRYEDNYKQNFHFPNAADASLQYAEDAVASEVAVTEVAVTEVAATEKQVIEPAAIENSTINDAALPTASQLHAMTMQRRHWHRTLNIISADDLTGSLKNKDLQPRGAHSEAVEPELQAEEMEYAMAA
jgi:hypothetical protein